MKFVVTGMDGAAARTIEASARYSSSSWSELNRSKSSSCPGLRNVGAARGGSTSANSEKRCDQNAVPHAALSASTVPYFAISHSRKASALTSQ